MIYTVRFAHLEKHQSWSIGDPVINGAEIGIMGNSGASKGAHLHLDVVQGKCAFRYKQRDIENGRPQIALRQLLLFVGDDLFGGGFIITTTVADLRYFRQFGKVHCGLDIVPQSPQYKMVHWNRSKAGEVIMVDNDPEGYGNCLYVAFEA